MIQEILLGLPLLANSIDLEQIESYMFIVWLVLFAVACLIEMLTTKLIAVWFAAGALLALVLSFIPYIPFWCEIIAFVVLVILLFCFRPLIKRRIKKD